MAGLLPSAPDVSGAEEADSRVVGVDSDDADAVFAALSSSTARRLLALLHQNPTTPSALAERAELSLQNTQYHLTNLENAGVIKVIDTCYSANGREMSVYAPTDRPLVLFAGREREAVGLKRALAGLFGAVGLLALVSLALQLFLYARTSVSANGGDSVNAAGDAARVTSEIVVSWGIPPGVLFFAGGATVLLVGFLLWYVWRVRSTHRAESRSS